MAVPHLPILLLVSFQTVSRHAPRQGSDSRIQRVWCGRARGGPQLPRREEGRTTHRGAGQRHRQTGILWASDPAWRGVRDQERDRNRGKPKVIVMVARERAASIQAIKMSHGRPRTILQSWGGSDGRKTLFTAKERLITLHQTLAGIEYTITALLTNGFLWV